MCDIRTAKTHRQSKHLLHARFFSLLPACTQHGIEPLIALDRVIDTVCCRPGGGGGGGGASLLLRSTGAGDIPGQSEHPLKWVLPDLSGLGAEPAVARRGPGVQGGRAGARAVLNAVACAGGVQAPQQVLVVGAGGVAVEDIQVTGGVPMFAARFTRRTGPSRALPPPHRLLHQGRGVFCRPRDTGLCGVGA